MSNHHEDEYDKAPGDENRTGAEPTTGFSGYLLGLVLSIALTVASFWMARTHLVYEPALPMTLITLAIAQMGIHLVFFLHITTAPDNKNNVLALAFGILIVCLIMFGSIWIMQHLSEHNMPMDELMRMQR
ncbi:MAG TPA: cytochrome o ubiquinol oxidase subunit IV [Rickettsiales bacterium]|nr:cytochrome o ubiquinol oxidase subunit IV [Rickettsiales bacterium]